MLSALLSETASSSAAVVARSRAHAAGGRLSHTHHHATSFADNRDVYADYDPEEQWDPSSIYLPKIIAQPTTTPYFPAPARAAYYARLAGDRANEMRDMTAQIGEFVDQMESYINELNLHSATAQAVARIERQQQQVTALNAELRKLLLMAFRPDQYERGVKTDEQAQIEVQLRQAVALHKELLQIAKLYRYNADPVNVPTDLRNDVMGLPKIYFQKIVKPLQAEYKLLVGGGEPPAEAPGMGTHAVGHDDPSSEARRMLGLGEEEVADAKLVSAQGMMAQNQFAPTSVPTDMAKAGTYSGDGRVYAEGEPLWPDKGVNNDLNPSAHVNDDVTAEAYGRALVGGSGSGNDDSVASLKAGAGAGLLARRKRQKLARNWPVDGVGLLGAKGLRPLLSDLPHTRIYRSRGPGGQSREAEELFLEHKRARLRWMEKHVEKADDTPGKEEAERDLMTKQQVLRKNPIGELGKGVAELSNVLRLA